MGRSLIITTGGGIDIEEGNPNALPPFVLSGYTFYAKNDEIQTGVMKTHWPDVATYTMYPDWYLDLPEGHYTGNFTCKAELLSALTEATATADQMSNGWIGWRNGARQVGTMPWWGSTGGETLAANGQHVVPEGQHDGLGTVSQSLWAWGWGAITPGIRTQTVVDAGVWTTGDRWVLGDGNLVSGNIASGVNIFGVWGSLQPYHEDPLVWSGSWNPGNLGGNYGYKSYMSKMSYGMKDMRVWGSGACWYMHGYQGLCFSIPNPTQSYEFSINFSFYYAANAITNGRVHYKIYDAAGPNIALWQSRAWLEMLNEVKANPWGCGEPLHLSAFTDGDGKQRNQSNFLEWYPLPMAHSYTGIANPFLVIFIWLGGGSYNIDLGGLRTHCSYTPWTIQLQR